MKVVTVRPSVSGSWYGGTIFARWRTANVIHGRRPPSRSPIGDHHVLDGRAFDHLLQRVAKFSRMTMAVAPESFSWCSSSRAVYSGLTFTQV
jgi:hypothetical protein